jgi:hypothetical protein
MGVPRTLAAVSLGASGTPGPRIPAYTGTPIGSASFSITKGIASVVLGSALPANGFNGPNGPNNQNGTTGAKLDIQAKWPAANGQQVTLWGFTTATYFNGLTVTVLDNDGANTFRFYFNHADVASTADTTGFAAPIPVEHYRTVRIEVDQAIGTDIVYVGDFAVSASRYVAALSLAGQISIDIASENIPADRIFLWASNTSTTDSVHVSLIY